MNWSTFKRTAWTAPAALAMLSMTACQTTIPIEETDARVTAGVCEVFPPIMWSGRDTPETIAQVRRHNAGLEAYYN